MVVASTPLRAQRLDETSASSHHQMSSSLLNTTQDLLSPTSPASSLVAARNRLFAYMDEVRSMLNRAHEYENRGLPEVYRVAVEDTLDGVVRYVDQDEPTEVDLSVTLERLQEEMTACGVTMYLEMMLKDARTMYQEQLESFLSWLNTTRHKSGSDQPLTEAQRTIMTDFAELERRWAEREDSICAPRRDFAERAQMIRELRNDDIERRETDERIAAVLDNSVDARGLMARRKQLFKHVGNRAAMLRATPKENLSMKQRRDCKHIATSVMAWIDENYLEGSIEDLADQLQRVCETTQETAAAADIVARRNELTELLDFIRSSITVHREVIDTLGPDRCEALAFMVSKAEHWLETHSQPSIQTLEKFVESLRLGASKYGLSPPTMDGPVAPPPRHGASASEATRQVSSSGAPPRAAPGETLYVVNVACTIAEELAALRVACVSAGAAAFIARRIAPLQLEVQGLLDDPLALSDGAGALLGRYKSVLCAVKTEAPLVEMPASCWTRVMPFDDVELTD